jgi:DNA-binding CsgD family transcriptional regulator
VLGGRLVLITQLDIEEAIMLSQLLLDHLDSLAAAQNDDEVWACIESFCFEIGFEAVNFGFLDFRASGEVPPSLRLLTSMDPGWIDYYQEHRFDRRDPLVLRIEAGERRPVLFRDEFGKGPDGLTDSEKEYLGVVEEAGVRNAVSVPVLAPFGRPLPTGGLTFMTSENDNRFREIWSEWGAEAALFAQAVHHRLGPNLLARLEGIKPLTDRERDCLMLSAEGGRAAEIADKLCLATVTVNLHLTQARKKLRAATLPEAVARAIRFGWLAP